MSNLDKNYILKLDLTNQMKNDTMEFSISDSGTSEFFVVITRQEEKIDLSNATIKLYVLKPDKTNDNVTLTYDSTEEKFHCSLGNNLKDVVGKYTGQIVVHDTSTNEKIVIPSKVLYVVNSDLLAELGIQI